MSKRSIVPFGPQHPVLPEPIHLDLVLEDEKVVEAIESGKYNKWLCVNTANYNQN